MSDDSKIEKERRASVDAPFVPILVLQSGSIGISSRNYSGLVGACPLILL